LNPTELSENPVKKIFALFVASRLWVALWVYAGHLSLPYRGAVAGGYAGVDNWWLNPWTTYDSYWYLRIAERGYEPLSTVFFPFYALLLRLAGPHEVPMALLGVIISNLGFAVGLFYLYKLTRLDADAATSWRTLFIVAFFPISAVFSAVYTEGLYFALLVSTFYFFRNKQWTLAIVTGFLVALTRNGGPLLALALLLEAARLPKTEGRWRAGAVALVPILGFAIVTLYQRINFPGVGTIESLAYYGRGVNVPWLPIWKDATAIFSGQALDITTLLNVAVTLSALGFFIVGWKKERPSSIVLVLGILLVQLTLGQVKPPYTNSSLRYMMPLFPYTQRLARAFEPLTQNRFRTGIGMALLLFACAVVSFLFGQKQYVTG
jgi:hypothetical protein